METKKFIEQNIINTLEKNYMPYAMSVIVSRAIPEIDGFKPSHRKLLYTMFSMGLLTGARTKSANVVGQTMKLNPHGDMAIYETLVRLARGYGALIVPLIDSKGNFGKQYSKGMKFAAPRYTEVKLDKICQEIFKDLEKNPVNFVDNYDGTIKEPVLLPTTFPNIIVNPNQGIAVGMASNICSFNLKEVCEATIQLIKDENADLLKYMKAPDFSTGGSLIYNEKDMRAIYKNGRGGFKVRAKYRVDKKNSCIEIIEIPYTTTVEAIMDAVIALVKSGKLRDVTDIRDETDLEGLKIAIDIKKNTDADDLMNKLYKVTPLEDTFSCNFNILIDGTPRVMGVKEILKEWLIFRIDCIKRLTLYDIGKKNDKLHLLLGLKKILLDIDKAIRIVRNTEQDSEVIPNLMAAFEIDEIQADFVAEIKLRNLNKEYILDKVGEVEKLKKEIDELNSIYGDENKINKIIIKQLGEVAKKYGQPRLTQIISEDLVEEVTEEDFIEEYNVKIFLTKHNYIKKIPLVSLRGSLDQKIKDDDYIMQEIDAKNKDELLLFSDKAVVYKLKIHELEDLKASLLGEYLTNKLGLDEDENIIYIVATEDYKGQMLFLFESGRAARIELSSYATKTNRKKLVNAYYKSSKLIYIMYLENDLDLVAYSDIEKVLVFNTSGISPKTTRGSQGVQVMRTKKGSKMIEIKTLAESLLTDVEYYRVKNIPAFGYYLKKEDKLGQQIEIKLD